MTAEPVAGGQGRLPEETGLPLSEIARSNGLRQVGGRPTLRAYTSSLFERRHFAWVLSRFSALAQNQDSYLGQAWNILNPLLNGAVYLVIFGYLLKTNRGIDNFIAYLLVGIFIFTFLSKVITSGSRAVTSKLGLINSLQFPRALLPISVVLTEMITLIPTVGVLLVLVPLSGEPLTWWWLLLPFVMVLMGIWGVGIAFVLARIVVEVRDVANLIPYLMRFLLYFSGVFFSIQSYAGGIFGAILAYQPVAVYIQLVRTCLMVEIDQDPRLWVAGAFWALVTLVVGYVYFWRAEAKYGRG